MKSSENRKKVLWNGTALVHFPFLYSLLILYLSNTKFRKVSNILPQVFLCNLGMYNKFIEANRLGNPLARLKQLKQLVKALPEYHYDTLLFLIRHLKVIADHSDENKVSQYNNLCSAFRQ